MKFIVIDLCKVDQVVTELCQDSFSFNQE